MVKKLLYALLKPKEGVESAISPWKGIEENFNIINSMKLIYAVIRQSLWAEELNCILHKVRVWEVHRGKGVAEILRQNV